MSDTNGIQPPPPAAPSAPAAPAPAPAAFDDATAMVPSHRFREAQEAKRAAQEAKAAAEAQAQAAQRELARYRQQFAMDAHLLTLARERPGLAHDRVRSLIQREYEDTISRLPPEARPTFQAWVDSISASDDPILSPHFKKAEAPAPQADPRIAAIEALLGQEGVTVEQIKAALSGETAPAAPPAADPNALLGALMQMLQNGGKAPAQQPGNPNAGTANQPGAGITYTDAQIAEIAADPVRWRQHEKNIRAYLSSSKGITLGSKTF